MATILKATQQAQLAYRAEDKRGNPTTVADPSWTSSDPTVLTVTPSTDGTSATAVAAGPVGTATVTLTGDADLGDGVSTITGVADFEVVAGDAAIFNILVGPPTEQADAPLPPIDATPPDGGASTPPPDGGATPTDGGATPAPDGGTTDTGTVPTPPPGDPGVSGGATPVDTATGTPADAPGGTAAGGTTT